MSRIVISVLCLAASVAAQTTATVAIGGPDTKGLQNSSNPPTLSDGTGATGEITYSWDGVDTLEVVVANTTVQTPGEQSPVVNEIYFNVPNGAVTAMTLVSQVDGLGSPTGFGFQFDADVTGAPLNRVGGFGGFNAALKLSSAGGVSGIISPAGTSWSIPAARRIDGPVEFVFTVAAENAGMLTAADFAAALSGSNDPASAALRFMAGGVNDGSGFIGTRTGCVPGLFLLGDPCVDPSGPNNIEFVLSNQRGCHNCLTISFDPQPVVFGGINLPGSPPYEVLWSVDAASSYTNVVITIPPDIALVGLPVIAVNLSWDMSPFKVHVSDSLSFTLGTCQ